MNWVKISCVVALFLFFIFPVHGFAATIYANYSTGNDTTGAGTSGSPYKTFHKAYISASANDTINLTGTFDWSNSDETGDLSTTGYTISKSLIITGQGADTTYIQASSTVYTANRRIFTVTGSGTTVTIQNVTLRYGYMSNSDNEPSAVEMGSGSVLTILNTIVRQNANNGRFASGAIEVNGTGRFIVRNSTFDTNNGIVSQQAVGGSWYGYTGAIEIYGTNTGNEITNTTFYNNGAQYNGAILMSASGGKLTVTNCTFIGNKGITSSTDILAWTGTVYLANNIFAQKASGATNALQKGSGSFSDGGNNIVETQTSAGFTNGVNGNLVGVQASLNIANSLSTNTATTGVQTLALSSGSVAINSGTTTSNNGISIPLTDARQFNRDASPDVGAYEYGANTDSTAPVISSVTVSTTTNTATITWTTDEVASTKVYFGSTSNYGTSTAEMDTGTRVTSHSVTLSNLVACSRYAFQVYSTDGSNNIGTSSNAYFRTAGCTGGAAVSSTGQGAIAVVSGGTVTEGTLTLVVPTSFTTATSSAVFQASLLDSVSFFASAGTPSGASRVGSTVYNLKALADATTTISSFASSLTVSLTYTGADIVGIEESSLLIYRYDGSAWNALSNCSVNTGEKKVTCTTTAFSDFSIFGTAITASDSTSSTSSSTSSRSGDSVQSRYNNLIRMGNIVLAEQLKNQYPFAFTDVTHTVTPAVIPVLASTSPMVQNGGYEKNVFARDLTKDAKGDDVRALQEFLISQDTGPIARELKRVGATGYFGNYTKNALGEFQRSAGILPYAGFFGPITREYVSSLRR